MFFRSLLIVFLFTCGCESYSKVAIESKKQVQLPGKVQATSGLVMNWGFTQEVGEAQWLEDWFAEQFSVIFKKCRPRTSLLAIRGEIQGIWTATPQNNTWVFRGTDTISKGSVDAINSCISSKLGESHRIKRSSKNQKYTGKNPPLNQDALELRGQFLLTFGSWDLPKGSSWRLKRATVWEHNTQAQGVNDRGQTPKIYQ